MKPKMKPKMNPKMNPKIHWRMKPKIHRKMKPKMSMSQHAIISLRSPVRTVIKMMFKPAAFAAAP